jgi:hypothetical protein
LSNPRAQESRSGRVLAAWRRRWFPDAPLADLAIARVLVVAPVLYLNGSLRFFNVARAPAITWDPIPLFAALGVTQPSAATVALLHEAATVSLVAAALGLCANAALLCAFVLQLVLEGFLNSFGKVTHATIPLLHAMLFFALAPCGRVWSLDALLRRAWRARRGLPPDLQRTSRFARWPFELLLVELAFYYFDAGLSKLTSSGLAWVDGATLQYSLVKLGGAAAAVIAPHLWLCALLSGAALAFELGFPLAIVFRRLRPWFLAAGVAFHLGNHVLLDLIFWPVLAVYPLVVPWSTVVTRLRGPRRTIALRASTP